MRTAVSVFCVAAFAVAASPRHSGRREPPVMPAPKTTSDVLAISGTLNLWRFPAGDNKKIRAIQWHVSTQTLTLRNNGLKPVHALVWARGLSTFSFADIPEEKSCSGEASREFREVPAINPGSTIDISYRICAPADASFKAQGSIYVSADGLPPESIAVAVENEQGLERQLLPLVSSLAGVLIGGLVTFFSFLAQQKILRGREREKNQQELIATNLPEVVAFFKNEYRDLLGSEGDWNPQRMGEFRDRFKHEGIYTAMTGDQRTAFDEIISRNCTVKQRTALIKLMESNFPGFVKPDAR